MKSRVMWPPRPIPEAWYVPPEDDRSRLPVMQLSSGGWCWARCPSARHEMCVRAKGHTGRHASARGLRGESFVRVVAVWPKWPQEAPE